MRRNNRRNVGLIGLGIIGSRVAAGLRTAGFKVYVWSRTPRPEPNFLGSAAEVAECSDLLQIFVSDGSALFDVLEQMAPALTPRHVVICSATVGPEATIEAARFVDERGAQFLDAPFTGSKGAAEQSALVYFIGGSDAAFEKAEPVLKATSKTIVKVGAVGDAATVKIATNMMAAATVQTLAEALALVGRRGVSAETFANVIEHHGTRSALIDLKLPQMIHGDFAPHFSVKHMFKDVQLGIQMANGVGLDIPATTATASALYGCINSGWEDLDFSVLTRSYAAAEVPAPAAAAALLPDAAPSTEPAETPSPEAPDAALILIPEEAAPQVASIAPAAEPRSNEEIKERFFRSRRSRKQEPAPVIEAEISADSPALDAAPKPIEFTAPIIHELPPPEISTKRAEPIQEPPVPEGNGAPEPAETPVSEEPAPEIPAEPAPAKPGSIRRFLGLAK